MMSPKMDKASIIHAARLDVENDINNNMEKDDGEPEVKGSGSEKQYEFVSYGESEDWSYFFVWKFFVLVLVIYAHAWVIMICF